MSVKEMILKMLDENKSETEIMDALLKEGKSVTVEELSEVFEAHEKKMEMKKAFDAKNATKAQKDSAAESLKATDELVQKKLEEALAKMDLPSKFADASKNADVPKFKSFLANFIIPKDDAREKMLKMIKADRSKNYEEARKFSNEFVEKSKLYTDEMKQKLLTGDTTTGSYAVPDEFSDQVFFVAQRSGNIFDNATKLSMSSDKLNLLGVSGDVDFTEVASQSTSLTNSEPTLSQTALDLIDAGAVSYLHDDLISDANVNVIGLLGDAYGRGLMKYTKRATTVGNVATTGDKVNGIYSISGVGSTAVADTVNGTISYDDIMNLIGSIDETFLDGAVFEMNLRELLKVKKIKDQNGMPILVSPMTGQPFFNILGYPVKLNNQMPITLNSTTGARTGGTEATILFGDPRQAIIGLKGGFQLESSIHYRFTARQTTFRGYIRWDMDVVNVSAFGRLTGIK